jgi:hypothetical protein
MSRTLSAYERDLIDEQYEKLVSRLDVAQIYGIPVDADNPKVVALAAHFSGGWACRWCGEYNPPGAWCCQRCKRAR